MKRKELENKFHGKWLAIRWEDNEVLFMGDSADEVVTWMKVNTAAIGDELVVVEQFLKPEFIDPLPNEVRLAVERFRRIAYRPMGTRLLEVLDKYYPKPPKVPT